MIHVLRFRWGLQALLLVLIATSLTVVTAQDVCEAIVNQALADAESSCTDVSGQLGCYGYDSLFVSLNPDVNEVSFGVPSDRLEVINLHVLESMPLDTDLDEWGIGYFQIQLDLPGFLDETNVRLITLGEVLLENGTSPQELTSDEAVPFSALSFTTGGASDCQLAPNALILQSPRGQKINVEINGVPMQIGSTGVFGKDTENGVDVMWVAVLDGEVTLYPSMPNEQVISAGNVSAAPLPPLEDPSLEVVQDRTSGAPILNQRGEPFYRRVPNGDFSPPQPFTPDGDGFRSSAYYRTIYALPVGLLNYPIGEGALAQTPATTTASGTAALPETCIITPRTDIGAIQGHLGAGRNRGVVGALNPTQPYTVITQDYSLDEPWYEVETADGVRVWVARTDFANGCGIDDPYFILEPTECIIAPKEDVGAISGHVGAGANRGVVGFIDAEEFVTLAQEPDADGNTWYQVRLRDDRTVWVDSANFDAPTSCGQTRTVAVSDPTTDPAYIEPGTCTVTPVNAEIVRGYVGAGRNRAVLTFIDTSRSYEVQKQEFVGREAWYQVTLADGNAVWIARSDVQEGCGIDDPYFILEPAECRITPNAALPQIRLYVGPSSTRGLVGYFESQLDFVAVGVNTSADDVAWYLVRLPRGEQVWVTSEELVATGENCGSLEEVAAPPLVMPPPTRTDGTVIAGETSGSCGTLYAQSPREGIGYALNTFFWQDESGADAYRLDILRDGVVVGSVTTPQKQASADLTQLSPENVGGVWSWQVTALVDGRATCTDVAPQQFRAAPPPNRRASSSSSTESSAADDGGWGLGDDPVCTETCDLCYNSGTGTYYSCGCYYSCS